MKKLFVSLFLLLGICVLAGAQDTTPARKVSIYSAIGLVSGQDMTEFFPDKSSAYTLAGVYEPNYTYNVGTPVFCVGAGMMLGKRFSLDVDLSWNVVSAEASDGVTRDYLGNCDIMSGSIMPGLKYYWAIGKNGMFYSGFDIGATALFISDYNGASSFKLKTGFDFIPIGLRFNIVRDSGLYLFGESMIGSRVTGICAGIGCSF